MKRKMFLRFLDIVRVAVVVVAIGQLFLMKPRRRGVVVDGVGVVAIGIIKIGILLLGGCRWRG